MALTSDELTLLNAIVAALIALLPRALGGESPTTVDMTTELQTAMDTVNNES